MHRQVFSVSIHERLKIHDFELCNRRCDSFTSKKKSEKNSIHFYAINRDTKHNISTIENATTKKKSAIENRKLCNDSRREQSFFFHLFHVKKWRNIFLTSRESLIYRCKLSLKMQQHANRIEMHIIRWTLIWIIENAKFFLRWTFLHSMRFFSRKKAEGEIWFNIEFDYFDNCLNSIWSIWHSVNEFVCVFSQLY